jgi:hypothetical protein
LVEPLRDATLRDADSLWLDVFGPISYTSPVA